MNTANSGNRAQPLWQGPALPPGADLAQAPGAQFRSIKAYEPERDGYHWLKGVALARHEDRWVASFGHNPGARGENNATEVAHVRISADEGATWGPVHTLDAPAGDLGVSHGVFLTHDDRLWAFQGAFYGTGRPGGRVHTRAYVAEPESVRRGWSKWEPRGVVAWDGFWPLQEPLRLADGRFIVAGASVGGGESGNTIPAVGLVDGDDPTQWTVVRIPAPMPIWGESTVVVAGSDVLLISRSNGSLLAPLTATSTDGGRTWTPLTEGNLPMAASKPYAGTLADGRPYLINTIAADAATAGRNPLCLLIGARGAMSFDRAYRIIDARQPLPGAEGYTLWAYPYAVERQGLLWIGFYMGTEGRHGSGAAGLVTLPVDRL